MASILLLKMSLLVISKVLGLFVNALTADEKYSPGGSENLQQAIQMQLSKKQKIFSQFFAAFLKFISNFEQFKQKDCPYSFCTYEIRHC